MFTAHNNSRGRWHFKAAVLYHFIQKPFTPPFVPAEFVDGKVGQVAVDVVEKVAQGELMVLGVCGVDVSHGFQDFGDLVQQLRDGFL